MWKSKNIDNYPIKPVIVTVTESGTTTRNLESGIKISKFAKNIRVAPKKVFDVIFKVESE